MTAFATAFLNSARVTRAELYGTAEDRQLPRHLHSDARLPFLGFLGRNYTLGGVLLLAINPGGGGASYQLRTPQDERLLPLIEAFINSSASEMPRRFDEMCTTYAEQVKTWNLLRIVDPVLQACGRQLDEVAYLNCFPYRTVEDRIPHTAALQSSWHKVIQPLLTELKPSIVIALGKKAGGVAELTFRGPGQLFVVPRTIGDSRISDAARLVLETLYEYAKALRSE